VADSPVVLGLDFGGTKIAMAVCEPDGEVRASTTVSSGGELGARASFERGIQAARDLRAAAAPGREVAAVGVSTFGIPFEDRVELAPTIDGWSDLPLGREVRSAFPGAAIRLATDAKAAAQAELRWGVLADCDPAIYLNLGTGLSSAIVAGGQVLRGGNGAAGEIGYNLRSSSDVGVPLAARTMLEDMISGQALARRASGHSASGHSASGHSASGYTAHGHSAPGGLMDAAEVFEASREIPGLDDLVTEFVAELAFHVVNLAICIDPVRIAVGGGMVRSWDRLRPGLEEALAAGVPFPPELVVARFPSDAPLIGAVGLAVDAAREEGVHGAEVTLPAISLSEGLPL
jgi:glucokinase